VKYRADTPTSNDATLREAAVTFPKRTKPPTQGLQQTTFMITQEHPQDNRMKRVVSHLIKMNALQYAFFSTL